MRVLLFLFGAFLISPAAISRTETTRDQLMAVTSLGTSEIYAGGDPRAERLRSVRQRLGQAFELIRGGTASSMLCSPSACDGASEKALCHALQSISVEKQAACREFLLSKAREYLALNSEEMTPFRLSAIPLHVSDKDGLRSVVAITKREPKGDIVFHDGTVARMAEGSLLALLTHELGHKIAPAEKDEKFFDALGAAVALYAPEHVAPAQTAPALPSDVSFGTACKLVRDPVAGILLGMILDLEGTLPTAARIAELKKALDTAGPRKGWEPLAARISSGNAGRANIIRGYFRELLHREPTAEEAALMLSRMASGDTDEFILASLVGDGEYLALRGVKTDEAYAEAIFNDLVGRKPGAGELEKAVKELARFDKASWSLALMKIGPEVVTRQMATWYRGILNRQPTSAESEALVKRISSGASWELARSTIAASPEYLALQKKRWNDCRPSPQTAGFLPSGE